MAIIELEKYQKILRRWQPDAPCPQPARVKRRTQRILSPSWALSGSGKSTLLAIAGLLLSADEGADFYRWLKT